MGRRGRPRHPDILTPREWEVLELLRQRLSNEQVADRLGISLDGAKYHVSQILSKLGVASREEAAAVALGERQRWWTRWPLWAKIAGAATMAGTVAGLALLAWGVLRTSDEPDPSPDDAAVTGPSSCPTAPRRDNVDFLNFVRLNGIVYESESPGFRDPPALELGDQYGSVRCTFQLYEVPVGRQEDGDAGLLEIGTPLYAIRGYDPAFRLAAIPLEGSGFEESVMVFEVAQNPNAGVGGDLLNIDGKVEYIGHRWHFRCGD